MTKASEITIFCFIDHFSRLLWPSLDDSLNEKNSNVKLFDNEKNSSEIKKEIVKSSVFGVMNQKNGNILCSLFNIRLIGKQLILPCLSSERWFPFKYKYF